MRKYRFNTYIDSSAYCVSEPADQSRNRLIVWSIRCSNPASKLVQAIRNTLCCCTPTRRGSKL